MGDVGNRASGGSGTNGEDFWTRAIAHYDAELDAELARPNGTRGSRASRADSRAGTPGGTPGGTTGVGSKKKPKMGLDKSDAIPTLMRLLHEVFDFSTHRTHFSHMSHPTFSHISPFII